MKKRKISSRPPRRTYYHPSLAKNGRRYYPYTSKTRWFKILVGILVGLFVLLGILFQGKHVYDHLTGNAHQKVTQKP